MAYPIIESGKFFTPPEAIIFNEKYSDSRRSGHVIITLKVNRWNLDLNLFQRKLYLVEKFESYTEI